MLIKLMRGATGDPNDVKIETGAKFVRYLSDGTFYDKGEVVEIGDEVLVDFMDTVRAFDIHDIVFVFCTLNGEHLMARCEGRMVTDYRKPVTAPPIEKLEELLDFDKWMV